MNRNIGPRNRFERGVLGVALVMIAFTSDNLTLFTVLVVLGSLMLGEAFSGYCLFHAMRKTKNMK